MLGTDEKKGGGADGRCRSGQVEWVSLSGEEKKRVTVHAVALLYLDVGLKMSSNG
jgi:hypothetical protein